MISKSLISVALILQALLHTSPHGGLVSLRQVLPHCAEPNGPRLLPNTGCNDWTNGLDGNNFTAALEDNYHHFSICEQPDHNWTDNSPIWVQNVKQISSQTIGKDSVHWLLHNRKIQIQKNLSVYRLIDFLPFCSGHVHTSARGMEINDKQETPKRNKKLLTVGNYVGQLFHNFSWKKIQLIIFAKYLIIDFGT